MTASVRSEHNRAWRFVVALALLLFCWTHRHALQLGGFADDLGLLAELPQRAEQGTLLADVFAKWLGPLWPGSTMWRPLAYSSFAFDAALWGHAPGMWRITNLLLHLGVATVVGLVATRLTAVRLAGAAAFATVLLAPWAPEVTLWLVGRFDGWATFAIAVSLWAALKSRGADRWCALSLAAAIAAYASKESALIVPLWIVLAVGLRAFVINTPQVNRFRSTALIASHSSGLLIISHWLLAAAYLVWRSYLFSGQAIAVYASAPEYRVLPLMARVLAHLAFPAALAPLAPIAATVVAMCVLLMLVVLRKAQPSVALVGCVMTVSVVVAVAIYFANPAGTGDGYRLYYLATVGLALIVAASFKKADTLSVALLVVCITALAVWQSRVAAEWTHASRTVASASRAMTDAAATLDPGEFGLVLLPDIMGHVPLARNAQGALTAISNETDTARDFFIIFTPPQLPEWFLLAQEDVVTKLTRRASAPAKVTRYFCFNSSKQSLEDLRYWAPGTLSQWTAHWREAVAARCPDITL